MIKTILCFIRGKPKRQFTPKMGGLSGYGGSIEVGARKALIAGLEWLDTHPKATPRFGTIEGVYGICEPDNEDAEELTQAILAVHDGFSSALFQKVVSTMFWIYEHGWKEYVKLMSSKIE